MDFESPVKLGTFLNFQYYLRGISDTDNRVIVDFWIEKDGNKISSGSDNFYLSDISNGTVKSKIFLPSTVESGIYRLNIEVSHKDFVGESYRTIEIIVRNGFATIDSSNTQESPINFVIVSLILLALLNFVLMYYFEKDKINATLAKEEVLIKQYRLSIFTLSFFVILGVMAYYLNSIGKMPKIAIYVFYLLLAVFLISILIGRQVSRKPEINFKKQEIKSQKTEKISPQWWSEHLKKINDWLQEDVKLTSKKDEVVLKNDKNPKEIKFIDKRRKKTSFK